MDLANLRSSTLPALMGSLRSPLSSRPVGRSELLISIGLALVVAIGVYASHVIRGGWYLDDWINVTLMSDAGSPLDAFRAMNETTYRLGLSVSLVLLHSIAGDAPSTYLTLGVLITALQGSLFYLVLRRVRLSIVTAAAAAVIFMVLPCIDSTRLWLSAIPIQIAGSLYLLGVLAALHGLAQSQRRRLLWHAAAVVLFVLSIVTYELTVGLVAVTFMLYAKIGGRGAAGRRLVADWAGIGVALAYLAPKAADARGAESSLSFLWDRATQLWTPTQQLFRDLIPWSDVLGGPVGLILLALGVVGIAVGRRDEDAAGLRAWATIAAVAAVFAFAGLVMLLPADPYFVPRPSGLGNRVGAFAAFGGVVLLIALIVIACGGVGALLRRPRVGFAVALVMIAATAANLTAREIRQQDPWAQSWDQQRAILSAVDSALGREVSEFTAVVTFRHTTFILPADVSVFAYSWDLRGALWHIYDKSSIVGYPWVAGSRCGPAGVIFPDGIGGPNGAAPYGYAGDLFFVDTTTGEAERIRDRPTCESVVAELTAS
jgi:hypothetical protein